ncbi:MAG: L-threonylcarbamoyladenylate synthase [Arenibacterium sp.]
MKPSQKTQVLTVPTDVTEAAQLLRQGRLVAFPTETVYGLGADATNGTAVAQVYNAKNRPRFNPLIAHVADKEQAQRYVVWSDLAERLAKAFWPGPLSLVLPLRDDHGLSELTTAGLPTLAVRVPAHPAARALLKEVGKPVAAPSANPSGRISPTTAAHVLAGLEGRIDAVLDGGACSVGLESTIIGLADAPVLLRPGGLAREEIELVLGFSLLTRSEHEPLNAPGQIRSHYAPANRVRLNAKASEDGEIMLGFGEVAGDLNLSSTSDLVEAAANLFGYLHRLDHFGQPIAVAPIPQTGLGLAINDRLIRAAAPRD